MHLVVFGLSMTSSWGNGHATVYRSLLPALAARGHHVTFFERDVEYYARRRDRSAFRGIELILYPSWPEVRARAMDLVRRADAVVTTSFCPDGADIQRELLALPGPVKVFYDMDTPVTVEGLEHGSEVILRYLRPEHIPEFDLYLSFTGGPMLAELEGRWRARRAEAFYLCADPEQHLPAAPQARFRARLSFLGTWAADRWEALQQLLLVPADQLPEERFALAGALYPESVQWPANLERWEHLAPEDHSAFYSSADFTLNVTRQAMLRWGYSPQGRLFEAALCESPIITDAWPGLDLFLEPGREVLVARSADDVVGILTSASRDDIRQMARRARRRVLAEHSGQRRAAQLEELLREG